MANFWTCPVFFAQTLSTIQKNASKWYFGGDNHVISDGQLGFYSKAEGNCNVDL